MTVLTLPANPPFSLPVVVNSHGWVQLSPFSAAEDGRELGYVTRLDSGRVVELVIREASAGVEVSAGTDGPLNESEKGQIAQQVTWMVGLDQDFSAFYSLTRDTPQLASVEAQARGRILRSSTLFEDVVKTILTTNTSWAGTLRMVKALVSRFGTALPTDPTRRAFPTPERLAVADEETLRSEAGLGYRAPYVAELARSVASGDRDLEALKTTDEATTDLYNRLLAIKGVGHYAAAHLLMLLSRYDFVPVDSWAIKMVSHEWHGGEPIGRDEVEAAFEQWGAWQGLAYWFWDWSYSDA